MGTGVVGPGDGDEQGNQTVGSLTHNMGWFGPASPVAMRLPDGRIVPVGKVHMEFNAVILEPGDGEYTFDRGIAEIKEG